MSLSDAHTVAEEKVEVKSPPSGQNVSEAKSFHITLIEKRLFTKNRKRVRRPQACRCDADCTCSKPAGTAVLVAAFFLGYGIGSFALDIIKMTLGGSSRR